MKSRFSKSWNRSKQPRKQRKYRANAPLHLRGKFLNAPLSPELRKKHGSRRARVRTGDVVKIMRGRFKGESGKVTDISIEDSKVFVEDIQINRRDGSKAQPGIAASNVMITELVSDQKRNLGEEDKK